MKELTINLNNKSDIPLYEQIYVYIKREIKSNKIKNGTKLPSSRALSAHLSVSRSTVDLAYSQLVSEGYIESIPCKGYYASDIALLYDIGNKPREPHVVEESKKTKPYIDFSPRGIDLSNFPYNTWRKISKNILSSDNSELFKTGDPKGDKHFRDTIADYLFGARGVSCNSRQIILGAGNEYLLLLLNQLFNGKRSIAMENPTYTQAYKVFESLGHDVYPIDMDSNGIKIDELYDSRVSIAYVMPSHQYPMGTVMPVKRRLQLLRWAAENSDRFIIEDDYDSEFRYKGKPIPALKSLDNGDNVIYIATFSKSISPSIRMSYMVLPEKLMEIYQSRISFYSSTVSMIDQAIVNEFITGGYYERHLNKMRSIYKNKHDILINELKLLRSGYKIYGENAGLHILLELDSERNEHEIIELLKEKDVLVYGLSDYYIHRHRNDYKPTLILGYANLTEIEIVKGTGIIKSVLETVN